MYGDVRVQLKTFKYVVKLHKPTKRHDVITIIITEEGAGRRDEAPTTKTTEK